MKTFSRYATTALTVAAVAAGSAAIADSEPTTATVEILAPIAITKDTDMNFGVLSSPTSASTARLSTAGAIVITQGDATSLSAGAAIVPASYTISAADSEALVISVDTISVNNGFALSNFTGDFNGSALSGLDSVTTTNATSAASGDDTLIVGADLGIPVGIASGDYTFTYNLNVDYN